VVGTCCFVNIWSFEPDRDDVHDALAVAVDASQEVATKQPDAACPSKGVHETRILLNAAAFHSALAYRDVNFDAADILLLLSFSRGFNVR